MKKVVQLKKLIQQETDMRPFIANIAGLKINIEYKSHDLGKKRTKYSERE